MNHKKSSLIGAGLGLAAFLALGLLPAALYGGYAGVLLAGGVLGTPLHVSWLVRLFVLGGMVFGTAAVGFLFTVFGAAVGAGVGAIVTPKAGFEPATNGLTVRRSID